VKNYLSDELVSALLDQFVEERYNAEFYLQISSIMMNKGWMGLSKQFYQQHSEEVEHSLLIFNFLLDLNTPFKIGSVDPIDFQTDSIMEIAEKYYEREQATTEDIQEELSLAEKNGEGLARMFLQSMLEKQQNELKEVFDFQSNAQLCGDDPWKVKVWSDSIS
jgi:ferritin